MSAPWPYNSPDKLRQAGYAFQAEGRCHASVCNAAIQWWKTPTGKLMPLDAATFEPHWATCKNAAKFKKREPHA